MGDRRALFCVAVFMVGVFPHRSLAQIQPGSSGPPTIQVTSRLVFLDVTVLDKQGRPVTNGLTKDDFTITEDKRPQRIFSFESPQSHTLSTTADENPDGNAPVTIFVLDLLNSSFEDFAFIRYSVRKYLEAQPALLNSPAEMMVIGNRSLELLQGPTRDKDELLSALDHLPAVLPYKWMGGGVFIEERFNQSLDALQQIALDEKGLPGRKNIIWVGMGSPGFSTRGLTPPVVHELQQYMHATTNMLVDARASLFVVYPGLKIGHFVNLSGRSPISPIEADAQTHIDSDNPFADDISFGVFVNETGGKLFYNRNDVDAEIGQSQRLGSEYYTLTYQPRGGDENGKFRQIRVVLRNPNLRALTKTGYYAPDKNAQVDPRRQTMINLAEAARSSIPFDALDIKVSSIVRHPDTLTADVTMLLKSKGLDWQAADNGKSATQITVAWASLTRNQNVLASKVERLVLSTSTQDPAQLANVASRLQLTVRVPRKTQSIRVVAETVTGGGIGAADLNRSAIEAAPEAPTPDPRLISNQPDSQSHE